MNGKSPYLFNAILTIPLACMGVINELSLSCLSLLNCILEIDIISFKGYWDRPLLPINYMGELFFRESQQNLEFINSANCSLKKPLQLL